MATFRLFRLFRRERTVVIALIWNKNQELHYLGAASWRHVLVDSARTLVDTLRCRRD